MRRLKILAVVLVMLSLFIACNKDDDKTNATTKNSNSKTTAGGGDSDAWWKQYASKGSSKSSEKTTAKSSAITQKPSATTKKSSATTAKNSSGGAVVTNKGNTTATAAQQSYTKVDQYTMTYDNEGGGKTTLTNNPNNKFIKAAILDLSSFDTQSHYPANQMMAYSFSDSNGSSFNFVFVYTSASRSNATLIYVINFNPDGSLDPLSGNNDYAYFPYANSGSAAYNTYRSYYVTALNNAAGKSSYYDEVKSTYTSAASEENVKVFLSWQ